MQTIIAFLIRAISLGRVVEIQTNPFKSLIPIGIGLASLWYAISTEYSIAQYMIISAAAVWGILFGINDPYQSPGKTFGIIEGCCFFALCVVGLGMYAHSTEGAINVSLVKTAALSVVLEYFFYQNASRAAYNKGLVSYALTIAGTEGFDRNFRHSY